MINRELNLFGTYLEDLCSVFKDFSLVDPPKNSSQNQNEAEESTNRTLNLLDLKDPMIQVVKSIKDPNSIFSFMNTCKKLHKDRLSWISNHPETLSFLFEKALTIDSLSELTYTCSPLSAYRQMIYYLTNEDQVSKTKEILSLFNQNPYDTKLSLKTSTVGGHGQMTFDLIMEILKKFPKTNTLNFGQTNRLSKEQFTKIVDSCPSLEHLVGEFPCQSTVFNKWILDISFPATLKTVNIGSIGLHLSTESARKLFSTCKTVEEVNLIEWKKDCDNGLSSVEFPNTIKKFYLSNTNINDEDLYKILMSCHELKNFNISNCNNIVNPDTFHTTFPKSIKDLDVSNTILEENGLENILKSCQTLRSLNINNCHWTSEFLFNAALQHITNTLRIFSLSQSEINDSGLQEFLERCTQLRELNLKNCEKITSQGFVNAIFPNTLKKLTLEGTTIDDQGFHQVLSTATDLNFLHLGQCPHITPEGFANGHFPKTLQTLVLSGTSIDRNGLHAIAKSCPNLRILHLLNCPNISEQDILQSGLKNNQRWIYS